MHMKLLVADCINGQPPASHYVVSIDQLWLHWLQPNPSLHTCGGLQTCLYIPSLSTIKCVRNSGLVSQRWRSIARQGTRNRSRLVSCRSPTSSGSRLQQRPEQKPTPTARAPDQTEHGAQVPAPTRRCLTDSLRPSASISRGTISPHSTSHLPPPLRVSGGC